MTDTEVKAASKVFKKNAYYKQKRADLVDFEE